MLQYLDDALGRLFSFLESSPLGKNTYVMIMSDNGPQLLMDEKDQQEVRRMTSLCERRTLSGASKFAAINNRQHCHHEGSSA
jgi:arylsulfatase A-like enzyme